MACALSTWRKVKLIEFQKTASAQGNPCKPPGHVSKRSKRVMCHLQVTRKGGEMGIHTTTMPYLSFLKHGASFAH